MSTPHVAFVTGAGRGIGAAIAQRLARSGAALILGARSQEATSALASAIRAEGGQAWPVYLDVSDPETIEEALELVRDLARGVGPLDTLVNNAGISISAPFLRHGRESGEDLYEKHMATNFHGARRMIEALAPAMVQHGHGRIVNVASSAALQGYAYAAAYAASKHALLGYGRSAALELARTGVTLNTLCPHYVDSPMTDGTVQRIVQKTGKSAEETRAFLAAQNPGGKLVTGEEVAELVHELCAGGQNGAVIELLGGGRRRVVESGVPNA
jgi:NAD(P)-dependent dehydrogenase (short-subunit alcohol dehydrogenase family)